MNSKVKENIFINGRVVPADEAHIPVNDGAVLYGDGAFETLRGYEGKPFRLNRHLARLEDTCRVLRLDIPVGNKEIEEAVLSLIAENGLDGDAPAYIRITVTGGPSAGPKGLARPGPSGIFIIAHHYEGYPGHKYAEGISVIVSGIKRNSSSPLSSIKSTNNLDSQSARQEAIDQGADDAVMLTTAGNLSEATSSNLFMVKGSEVITPDVGCGFLPGITREAVIELCWKLGIECKPVMAGLEVLLNADEVFLTNSLIEVMPVAKLAGKTVGNSCPGPITRKIASAYRQLVREELGLG